MSEYLILGVVLGIPLLVGLVYRVSSSHIFFSVMAGELLARYFGHNLEEFIRGLTGSDAIADYGEILVLTAPMLLTAVFLKHSLTRGKTMLHAIPLAITGVVYAAFVLPLLPAGLQAQVEATRIGSYLLNMNSLIIGAVVLTQLVALWYINRNGKLEKSQKRSKKSKGG